MSLEDPDFDFVNLVVTIGTSAQANLGEIPDFRTGKPKINLALARTNINMLASLKRKTEGRLSSKELKVITDFMEDLQTKYLALLKSGGEAVKAKHSSLPSPPPEGGREVLVPGGGTRAEKLIALIKQKRKEMGV